VVHRAWCACLWVGVRQRRYFSWRSFIRMHALHCADALVGHLQPVFIPLFLFMAVCYLAVVALCCSKRPAIPASAVP
jgi:hypothetical protein